MAQGTNATEPRGQGMGAGYVPCWSGAYTAARCCDSLKGVDGDATCWSVASTRALRTLSGSGSGSDKNLYGWAVKT